MVALVCENCRHWIVVSGCTVSLGMADRQPSALNDMDRLCDVVGEKSIYALLHRECNYRDVREVVRGCAE